MSTGYFAEVPVDVSKLSSLRAEHFPYSGPYPWLDQPDALEQIEARVHDGRLTFDQAEQCRFWVKNGYMIVPKLIDDSTLDLVWEAYEKAVATVSFLWRRNPPAKAIPIPGDSSTHIKE